MSGFGAKRETPWRLKKDLSETQIKQTENLKKGKERLRGDSRVFR